MTARADRERDYWNQIRTDDRARAAVAKYYAVGARRQQVYFEALRASAGEGVRMLELGCSDGRVSMGLAKLGADVVGIDISEVAITRARRFAEKDGVNVRFDVGDAADLPYADASFDVIFASAVVHHLDVPTIAHEVRRVARAGARAVFLEPLGSNPLLNLYRRATPAARTVDERPLRGRDVACLRRDWSASRISYFDFLTLAAVPFRRTPAFNGIRASLASVDTATFRIPGLWRLAWFALIELAEPR